MTESRLDELLATFAGTRVLVVGDFCLDRYGHGRVQGVSRETGQPVPRLRSHFFSPGAAGTVAWNLADLGAEVVALPVIGQDRYGEVLLTELEARSIAVVDYVLDRERLTPSYEKLQIRHDEGVTRELRVDVANDSPLGAGAEGELIAQIGRHLCPARTAALVVADYDEDGTGVVTEAVRNELCALADGASFVTLVTSRANVGLFANFGAVPNEYELVTASGLGRPGLFAEVPEETVAAAAEVLTGRGIAPLFVTRGARGIMVAGHAGAPEHVPTVAVAGQVDITGAGDSALAAIALALAGDGSPAEAAFLGNMAAHVTVQKLGTTGTATPEELRAVYRERFASLAA